LKAVDKRNELIIVEEMHPINGGARRQSRLADEADHRAHLDPPVAHELLDYR
jgi:hypothetical protein